MTKLRPAIALLCLATVLGVFPAVASAQSVAKGELRGSITERSSSDVNAQVSEYEPDGSLEDATDISDDLSDGSETITGNLDASNDFDDVYAVYLYAGETVSLSMSAGDTTDFGMYLFSSDATDVAVSEPVAGVDPYYYGGPSAYPTTFEYEVHESGYYFIDAWTWSDSGYDGGSGAYSITVDFNREATGLTISPSTTYSFLSTITVSGTVFGARDGVPSGNAVLYAALDGIQWVPVAEQALQFDGTYSFTGYLSFEKTYYMVVFEGTDSFGSSASTTCFGSRAGLSTVSATRLGTRKYRLSGLLGPQHASGSYPVRVYLWRKVNGSWKAYGYQKAVASDYGYDTRYSKTYTFPYKGSWRLQAYHADGDHATTRSGYSYKSVY